METKAIKLTLPEGEPEGTVRALFARFNVIDHDGDVTLPGFLPDGAPVRISAYGHSSWGGQLPVGKGVIRRTDEGQIFEGRFFLDTQAGRDTYLTVKEMGDLQEWSYGFDIMPGGARDGEFQSQRVRFLQPLEDGSPGAVVHEVSPVLVGAGIGTRTLAVKSATKVFAELAGTWEATQEAIRQAAERVLIPDGVDGWVSIQGTYDDRVIVTAFLGDSPARHWQFRWTEDSAGNITLSEETEVELTVVAAEKGWTFADHAARVLGSVDAFTERSKALAALRAKDGRTLSAENRDRLRRLADQLGSATKGLSDLLAETDPGRHHEEAARLFAAYQKTRANLSKLGIR